METTITIDIMLLIVCSFLLLRFANIGHSHPAVIYMFFHFITITLRLISISYGAPTLFQEEMRLFDPVDLDEITRATYIADTALVIMSIAWIHAARAEMKPKDEDLPWRYTRQIAQSQKYSITDQIMSKVSRSLDLKNIWLVVAIAFPIGMLALYYFSELPGRVSGTTLGEWNNSSWLLVSQSWPGLVLLALIYWYGFRWWLILPMAIYLMVMGYQGFHRFRVIIPIILMAQIYLDRNRLRWPPLQVATVLIVAALLFLPLKTIGRMAQDGASLQQISDSSSEIIQEAFAGKSELQFLDMFACSLTLTDEANKFYYGAIYIPLVTLPIPRQLWPEKPGLSDFLFDISTPKRPMGELGMVVTFLGECYVNFGYIGILVLPYLAAYFLARIYFYAYRNEYLSIARFGYLLLACNLIQVYRDGFLSIVIFTLVNMMPLCLIVFLHYFNPVALLRTKNK